MKFPRFSRVFEEERLKFVEERRRRRVELDFASGRGELISEGMRVGKRRDKHASSCPLSTTTSECMHLSRFLCGSLASGKEEKTRTKRRAKGRNCEVKIKMLVVGRNRIPDCRVAGQSGSVLVVRLAHDSDPRAPSSSGFYS